MSPKSGNETPGEDVMQLATAPNSWGVWHAKDTRQMPWNVFLDGVAEIGFQRIEAGPFGYFPTDVNRLKDELNRRRISVIAGQVHGNLHVPEAWTGLEQQTRAVGRLNAALGGTYLLVIGGGSVNHVTNERLAPPELTAEQWHIMVEAIERIGRISLDDYGLCTVFHPTIDGFCETQVEHIERMLRGTDPAYVSLCLDTGQFFYRNRDPVPFLKTHADRIPYIHCKDIVPDIHSKLAQRYIPFSDRFCPIGEGEVDFPGLLHALGSLNYEGYLVIDEDQYGAPLERIREVSHKSFELLSGLVFTANGTMHSFPAVGPPYLVSSYYCPKGYCVREI